MHLFLNPLSANPTKWPNTLKQFVYKLPTNCLSVFEDFVTKECDKGSTRPKYRKYFSPVVSAYRKNYST